MGVVSWEFLEANEAKNESDTIGGFTKTALRHTILRNPDLVILTADDWSKLPRKVWRSLASSQKNTLLSMLRLFHRLTVQKLSLRYLSQESRISTPSQF
jgi:hypothetical protein